MLRPQGIVEHLEKYFGRIQRGWNPTELNDPAIQVVEFSGGRVPNAVVISSLGVSSFELQSPVSDKKIRQELFFMLKPEQVSSKIPAILDQIVRERVRSNVPVLRGDTIRKQGTLLDERTFASIYATLPIYYPNDFWTFENKAGNKVVFGWLLPIYEKEHSYISQRGWSAFEGLLDGAKVDLFDLDRPCLV